MSSSKKHSKEPEKNLNLDNNSPFKKSSSSYNRRSTNVSKNKHGKYLANNGLANRNEDISDNHFRQSKTSIEDNKDDLLNSIIQSR